MLLLTICCCLLGVVCAGPRQDDIVDAATDQEAGDLKTMASLVDIMSEADVTSYEDILVSNPDKDASWILHYIKENELADLDEEMVEEYFKGFIRMEMTSLMELVPEPLARFSGLRIPCIQCTVEHLQCKGFCIQLLSESISLTTDMFACLATCWQRVVSCCVTTRRNRIKVTLAEED